jgi:ribonuclease HII
MVIVGIDEVGRGCWAGPLVAGAVILKSPVPGLRDSKKLSRLQREQLAPLIYANSLAVGVGWVQPREIDKLGLSQAVRLAMQRALALIAVPYDQLIIDGNINYFPDNLRARAIIKADDSVPTVSAASIVAKVARDDYMLELDGRYPEYGFAAHVGYGTAHHSAMLKRYGVSKVHRYSFKPIKSLL